MPLPLGSFAIFRVTCVLSLALHDTTLSPNLNLSKFLPVGFARATPSSEMVNLRGMDFFAAGFTTSTSKVFGRVPRVLLRPNIRSFQEDPFLVGVLLGDSVAGAGEAGAAGGFGDAGLAGALGGFIRSVAVTTSAAASNFSLGFCRAFFFAIRSLTILVISPRISFTTAGEAHWIRRSFFPEPGMWICRSSCSGFPLLLLRSSPGIHRRIRV